MWQMDFNAPNCSVSHMLPSKHKRIIDSLYTLHGQTLETVEESKFLGVTISTTYLDHTHGEWYWKRIIKHSASYAETSRIVLHKWKQPLSPPWFALPLNTQLQFGTYLQKDIKALEQIQCGAARYVCNDYSTGTSGCVKGMVNKLQWESLSTIVETTESLCCADWSIYIQTATYNKVTDEQEGNIVSTKKELEVSLQLFLLPKNNQASAPTLAGGIQGKPLLFATQCAATSLPVFDVQSFNRVQTVYIQ